MTKHQIKLTSLLIYVFNDVESKMAKFLQLIGTIKRTIFRKVRTESILKIYNNLIVPTFLYGSENLTLTVHKDEDLKRQK